MSGGGSSRGLYHFSIFTTQEATTTEFITEEVTSAELTTGEATSAEYNFNAHLFKVKWNFSQITFAT